MRFPHHMMDGNACDVIRSLGPAPASAEPSGASSGAPTSSPAALRGPSLPFHLTVGALTPAPQPRPAPSFLQAPSPWRKRSRPRPACVKASPSVPASAQLPHQPPPLAKTLETAPACVKASPSAPASVGSLPATAHPQRQPRVELVLEKTALSASLRPSPAITRASRSDRPGPALIASVPSAARASDRPRP